MHFNQDSRTVLQSWWGRPRSHYWDPNPISGIQDNVRVWYLDHPVGPQTCNDWHACCQSAGVLPGFLPPHHARWAGVLPRLGPQKPWRSSLSWRPTTWHFSFFSQPPPVSSGQQKCSLSLKNKNFRLLKSNSQAGKCLCQDFTFHQKSQDGKGPAAHV